MKYNWKLSETTFTKDKGKVFSCFACGGGSTMGYKLAGFDVIGANDIDSKMAEVYKVNHNPKHYFLESITELAKRKDLPKELYDLDILDGSPPCSSFSMAGSRKKSWGKEKKFREGQAKQVLDTLFFDFIDLAKELQAKVVVAENVKGLLMGSAIEYVKRIYEEFDKAGYYCQHWLLNAAKMGVPQRRERVFFICLRKDLATPFLEHKDMFTQLPKLVLDFNEKEITFREIDDIDNVDSDQKMCPSYLECWYKCLEGDGFNTVHYKGMLHNAFKVNRDKVLPTIPAHRDGGAYHWKHPRGLTNKENCLAGSFPLDYNFINLKSKYVIGMSVPPLMTCKVAEQIYKQWLSLL